MNFIDRLRELGLELGKAALEELSTNTQPTSTSRGTRRPAKAPKLTAATDDDWHDDDDDWRDSDDAPAPRPNRKDVEVIALLAIAGGGAALYSWGRSRKLAGTAAGATIEDAWRYGAEKGDDPSRSSTPRAKATTNDKASDANAADTLGVGVDADVRTIKAAFRKKVREVHPDLASSDRAKAASRTRGLIEARDRLLRRRARIQPQE